MERTIKVSFSMGESKEVSVEEAKRIMDEAYRRGGFVFDKKNNDVIAQIDQGMQEIFILNTIIVGG